MEVDENHVQTLLCMGFPNEKGIRIALKIGKNDLNEAVAILTNEQLITSYDLDTNHENVDVEMFDIGSVKPETPPARHVVFGPENRTSLHTSDETQVKDVSCYTEDMVDPQPDDYNPLEFPVTNLYELEERVFTEHWSIPYKKEESLGKCLLSATRLAEAGIADSDEHCSRFMDRCLPEAFLKLLTSGTVHRWTHDIQEGIYNMLQLLMDLVAARLHHLPVHIGLLDVLHTALNPECEFHYKNKVKKADRAYRDDMDGDEEIYSVRSSAMNNGWLINLINRFGEKGGFDRIKELLESKDSLDAPAMAAVLRPCGMCAEYLNRSFIEKQCAGAIKQTIEYVQSLQENDFKEKKVGSVCDLLASLKLLYMHTAPSETDDIDALGLDIVLRMLKSPHFNAKMNSLKELSKLIEESMDVKKNKTAINTEAIVTWLSENNVLAISLEGNVDQSQYCDKVKGIVEFLGSNLTLEDLSMIWKIQNGQTNNVIDNIYSIITAAAIKFYPQQLEHLFLLIQKNWKEDNDRVREKLLTLIGAIGKDAKIAETTTKVLELLWDLAHLPVLSTHLIEQALEAHLSILNDSYIVKESVKRQYVLKCIDDIRMGVWVLPAIKQLLHITKNLLKQNSQKTDKGILHELQKTHDVIKLVSQSLIKTHRMSVSAAGGQPLTPDLSPDGRYKHSNYVTTHLSFLQYILQEGVLYLHSSRARDIWATLIANTDACEWDRETCYEWFSKGLSDLQVETQSQLFQKEVLKLDPTKLSQQGFSCVKSFFECVNVYEDKLKKSGNSNYTVEKVDLSGMDFVWEICLNTPHESIANSAITLLLSYSYTNLASRLKKDTLVVHKKFISECYSRLESARLSVGGSSIGHMITVANKILIAPTVSEAASVPAPSKSVKLLNIERLLWLAERYVTTVEGIHCDPRSILPHGASYHGNPINICINCESTKQEFVILCHTNETLSSLRDKVACELHQTPDNIQIVANEKVLSTVKDEKMLHQLDFVDNQMILARFFSPTSIQTTPTKEAPPIPTAKQTFDLEQEKMLPGVLMAAGGQVFDMLYQLAELDDAKVTLRVRKLLMLIPTDPSVSDAFDYITQKGLKLSPSSDDSSPRSSPKKSHASPSVRTSPRDTLKSLLDITTADMTAFRLLYNLEVLSSKLMPTTRDVVIQQSAHVFCEDFLVAGGLNMVVIVLQKDSIPTDLDNETRQGCYAICLQLARFLLCGQKVTDTSTPQPNTPLKQPVIERATLTVTISPPSINIPSTTGSRAIQTMGETEFTETLSCFMTVTWAAAAGRLRLVASPQPIRESSSWTTAGRRSRQNSTGSTGSTGSESESQSLHAGVCIQQSTISHTDTNIAKEALELLVTCLQLRSQLVSSFYNMPCVSEFIIDLLVGSTQFGIRHAALEQFHQLSQTSLPHELSLVDQPTPHQFILQVLLKAYLPFWVTATATRGASQRLLSQCSQYFDLRCRLLENLTESNQSKLKINPKSMLDDELAWLSNFTPSDNPELRCIDNNLLAGHLKLITTLLTCHSVNKEEFGKCLIPDLLNEFLFPASKLITACDVSQDKDDDLSHNFNPKCSHNESRLAAYALLTELANGCLVNLKLISSQLLSMHHGKAQTGSSEWEYMPPVDGRAACGFVGLKNAGATCYMNSILQQLYMTPGISEYILSVDSPTSDDDSVFYQVQQMMGDLMESKLQYHVPEKFWKVFKLWGQPVNVREQQDAFDFFQALIDQIDEYLKSVGKERLFLNRFQGIYSDQKICKDCPHRYEREEVFYALNLTVKNATLQDSLDQFVKGELLEGDNAYFCEKCGEKRNTIKRLCIKSLPPTLCIQLKRFGYDWETNRALKFDDFFKFPWTLDMEPYTAEGMSSREAEESGRGGSNRSSVDGDTLDKACAGGGDTGQDLSIAVPLAYRQQINYDLVGIVVHSGQANAGHYYSYIKERRGRTLTNPQRGKWFKFNDTIVEEFDMTEASIEEECFGGSYKAKVYEQSSSYPEERQRYWNGYMLFYERVDDPTTPGSAKKTKLSTPRKCRLTRSSRGDSDSLIELTQLIHKGDKRGLFVERMPASIQQTIHAENITFIKNRDVYNVIYLQFVRGLVDVNSNLYTSSNYSVLAVQSMQLAVTFLVNTYFRISKKLRSDMDDWVSNLDRLMYHSRDACLWLVSYLAVEPGSLYIKPYLLDCPNKDVRVMFAQIVEKMITNYFHHGCPVMSRNFTEICESLLRLLNKDVVEHYKNSVQYFGVFKSYVEQGTQACAHLFGRNAFQRLMFFLLGHPVTTAEQEIATYRHWSSFQARDFGNLHSTIALLILNCDVSQFYTQDVGTHKLVPPTCVNPRVMLNMSAAMKSYVFGSESVQYIKEVVHAVREVNGSQVEIVEMLRYCSFCNQPFTTTLLTQITMQFVNAPSNELKMTFTLLNSLLTLEDPLQLSRIQVIVDGDTTCTESGYNGLLSIIRSNHVSDSRRSYQCIKFLVTLANRCPLAKDYLLQTPNKWQWAVDWLKKKMTEYLWNPPSSVTISNDDSNRKSFQRTVSAQDTLDEATALLTELESCDTVSDMDTSQTVDEVDNKNKVVSFNDTRDTGGEAGLKSTTAR